MGGGHDFRYGGRKYQIKANRPSGKRRSTVTLVAKARNYEWDVLVWLLYNEKYELREAWSWTVEAYREAFDGQKRLSPKDMGLGDPLYKST